MKQPKYRILRVDTTSGDETNTTYLIQKRFLFWYSDLKISAHYFTFQEEDSPRQAAAFRKCDCHFADIRLACQILSMITTPYSEIYKGNRIVKRYSERYRGIIYVNLSHSRSTQNKSVPFQLGFEFHTDLDELKSMIDKRIRIIIKTPIPIKS